MAREPTEHEVAPSDPVAYRAEGLALPTKVYRSYLVALSEEAEIGRLKRPLSNVDEKYSHLSVGDREVPLDRGLFTIRIALGMSSRGDPTPPLRGDFGSGEQHLIAWLSETRGSIARINHQFRVPHDHLVIDVAVVSNYDDGVTRANQFAR